MTYFLMLLFVFWTILILRWKIRTPEFKNSVSFTIDCLYALLGTFFFHNIW
jgi:hypothetical protein